MFGKQMEAQEIVTGSFSFGITKTEWKIIAKLCSFRCSFKRFFESGNGW